MRPKGHWYMLAATARCASSTMALDRLTPEQAPDLLGRRALAGLEAAQQPLG